MATQKEDTTAASQRLTQDFLLKNKQTNKISLWVISASAAHAFPQLPQITRFLLVSCLSVSLFCLACFPALLFCLPSREREREREERDGQICPLLISHTGGRLTDWLPDSKTPNLLDLYLLFFTSTLSYCFVLTLFTPHPMFCCAARDIFFSCTLLCKFWQVLLFFTGKVAYSRSSWD